MTKKQGPIPTVFTFSVTGFYQRGPWKRRQPSCWIQLSLKQYIRAAWFPEELLSHFSHHIRQVAMVVALGSQPLLLSCCRETCSNYAGAQIPQCANAFPISRFCHAWKDRTLLPGVQISAQVIFFQRAKRYNRWDLQSWTVKDCNALHWQRTIGVLFPAEHW